MKLYCYISGILILLICCTKKKDETSQPPTVKQDPTLTLISADVENNDAVHIEGKIIAPVWLENPVYGIVYSVDSIPTVNSLGKIVLGNVRDSANIDYTIKDLSRWENYTFRLFITTEKGTWYSLSKQVVPPSFQIAPLKDSVISRNTILKVYFTEPIPADQTKGFEVYVGDKKVDSINVVVDASGSITFLVPIDYKQGTSITIKKGSYSQTIVPDIPVLPGYWKRIPSHEGYLADNAAYFTLGNNGYIIGGHQYLSETQPINAVWEIDLSTYKWKKKNPFPITLHSAMAVTINNKGYLFGGVTDGATPNDKVWEYDPVSDSWQSIGTMNDVVAENIIGRLRMSTAVYNNKIYMGGGIRLGGSPNFFEYWYTKYWVTFDPVARVWENLPQLPSINKIQSMTTYTYDNKLYLFGGDNSSHESGESFALDFSNKTWSKPDITRSLPPRTGVSVINKNNTTYFFGGYQYKPSTGPSGGRFGVMPEFWKMDENQHYTQLASASTSEFVSGLNRNAPIFATANGFIVYNVLTWNGNNTLTRAIIEYVPE
ncbi:Galactose oxidase, central domain [Chitinophaga sp. CF118]|uniref:Kelch repeat-containing protein n=1 Tax=Chitinophaga sp. CF118 TaxID=1884367 RepID=UPI0008E860A9|nr:kelch repeat-containing protein [Chitinophaga sp. CF118]SFD26041.1 Galactose oxidase, central domain [Chitinophaga sp. CF118]